MKPLILALLLLTLGVLPLPSAARVRFALRDGETILFLGDSNTFTGTYVHLLDAYLTTRFPDRQYELINLGLPSETVTGLSEPDHPFPRPDVHERLERALERTRPNVVVACYGMNDGIYYPFSRERFRQYQAGMRKLVERVTAAGARLYVMTPPPFDAAPLGGKAAGPGAEKYSWMAPFAGYDQVLRHYSEWLPELARRGVTVLDLRTPILQYVAERRQREPAFTLAPDGVHFTPEGHWIAADVLLRAWGAPPLRQEALIDAHSRRLWRGPVRPVSAEGGAIRFALDLPAAAPPSPGSTGRLRERVQGHLGEHWLVVRNLRQSHYELREPEAGGRVAGRFPAKRLADGIDLQRLALQRHERSARAWDRIVERRTLLDRAWLTAVGHQRPDTPGGIPLDEARRRAAALDPEIRELVRPRSVLLELAPAPAPR